MEDEYNAGGKTFILKSSHDSFLIAKSGTEVSSQAPLPLPSVKFFISWKDRDDEGVQGGLVGGTSLFDIREG